MQLLIKSLNPETCDRIDEVYDKNWRVERKVFYEDGEKMYDVLVNLDYVTIETDEDIEGVWIRRSCDNVFLIDAFDFLEIIIR